jgi:hypothetical protein
MLPAPEDGLSLAALRGRLPRRNGGQPLQTGYRNAGRPKRGAKDG